MLSAVFSDGASDWILTAGEDNEAIVREIHRLLKPGGTAIVTYRNEKNLMISDPVGPLRFAFKRAAQALGLVRKQFRIGDAMNYKEVRRVLERNGLALEAFRGIGFGPLRFNHRPLLSERASLRIHRALTRWLDGLGAELPFRLATDVHILVVRKPNRN